MMVAPTIHLRLLVRDLTKHVEHLFIFVDALLFAKVLSEVLGEVLVVIGALVFVDALLFTCVVDVLFLGSGHRRCRCRNTISAVKFTFRRHLRLGLGESLWKVDGG